MARHDVTITAAVTTFNQARYLRATLESVFQQTRPADEVVVVDDGSTDDTAAILADYSSRARLVRQRNAGVAAARNRAVLESRSEFVALLDGDDLWLPEKLARCAEATAALPLRNVIVHDIETVSADGRGVIRRAPMRALLEDAVDLPSSAGLDAWPLLLKGNFIWTTSQVMVHRATYIAVGASDARFRVASDYDLYLRLAERGAFAIVPEVLTQWRQHDASASGPGAKRQLNWGTERVNVLRTRALQADESRREALLRASKEQLGAMAWQAYLLEETNGSWRTAMTLLHMAIRCRDVWCGTLAVGVLLPQPLRRAAASLTRRRVP